MRRPALLTILLALSVWFSLAPAAVAQEGEEDVLEMELPKGMPLEEELKGLEKETKQEIVEQIQENPQDPVRENISEAIQQQADQEAAQAQQQVPKEQQQVPAKEQQQQMPKTGGPVAPSVLLGTAALLLGLSVLTYVFRWRGR